MKYPGGSVVWDAAILCAIAITVISMIGILAVCSFVDDAPSVVAAEPQTLLQEGPVLDLRSANGNQKGYSWIIVDAKTGERFLVTFSYAYSSSSAIPLRNTRIDEGAAK